MKNEKRDLSYSTYAVTLYFDDEASKSISNLTESLAQIIDNDYMIANRVPPHLTLGMFHVEDSDLQKLNTVFGDFVETASKEVFAGEPLELPLAGPDSFLDKVLFLKPAVNEKLVSLNKLLHKMFIPHFEPGDNRNYLPENWLPHIALAVKLTHKQFEKGMEFLKGQKIICRKSIHEQNESKQSADVKIVSIGLAECNPYNPIVTVKCV